MHVGSLRALELDRIVEVIRGFAQTPGGDARLAALVPSPARHEVAAALAATSETVRFLEGGALTLAAPVELDLILEGLAVEAGPLEPLQLLAVAGFLASVEAACNAVRRVRGGFPRLAAVADRASSFEQEIAAIRRAIDPGGEVLDDASAELRRLREALRRQRTRLRGALEAYLRGRETAKYLQQQIVTDRHGRYVLVVRAEHRGAIPGIVHGSSGSGASLYLEPLNTVEINNDIVALQQQEAEEVHRILLALTDAFRSRPEDLARTVEAATDVDVLNARARFSMLVNGVEPVLAEDDRLELRGARHPLLIPAVRRRLASPTAADGSGGSGSETGGEPARDPVPVDILLVPPVRVLVITGPNTGGKTVALKTAGLLPLLAQAGLLIPAEAGSQVPVFRSVFADIGDEQSIAQSLSTFSGHIANIVAMDRALETPALVLLDEAGAGTDPLEGGALAMAIIEHFRVRGAMVLATTHYDALKTYASTTEGATPAGFGFDPVTFAPTYTLNYGSPGSSLAFEIAGRLGLPPSIIDGARARRGERETALAEHLTRLERDRQALEDERRVAARERDAFAQHAARLQARDQEVQSREDALRRRLDRKIEERLREARREIDAVVGRLKARTETLATQAERRAAPVLSTGETGSIRAEARAAIGVIEERLRRSASSTAPAGSTAAILHEPARAPAVGDRVVVGALQVEGTVRALQERTADVEVRGKRLRARVGDLRVVAPAGDAADAPRVRVHVDLQPREGLLTELTVVGCTVDEALARAEKFLDDAVVTEQRSVRIVHGFGTGQLRRALGAWLEQHPSVARSAPARSDQGGGGVTVVELKE